MLCGPGYDAVSLGFSSPERLRVRTEDSDALLACGVFCHGCDIVVFSVMAVTGNL